MARRFNKKTATVSKTPDTINLAGGKAFSQTEKVELASILLTSFLKNQFYRSADQTIERLQQLLKSVDPLFAAKAAVYARKVFGMRSVSHLVASEIGANSHGTDWGKYFFKEVVQRPDDVTEILSAYMTFHGKTLPNAMKKGLGSALSKFNEYQLGKYRGDQNDISLVDAVNMVHPPHTKQLRDLVRGELKTPETWEVKLSQAGQGVKTCEALAKRKAKVWSDLLSEGELGYFALLRNLRNIYEQSPDSLNMALAQLVDEKQIKNSQVMPFRFATAIDKLRSENCPKVVLSALNKALEISLGNIPHVDGSSLIVVDHSGSMQGEPIKNAALFAAALYKIWDNVDLMFFSDEAQYAHPNPDDTFTTIRDQIINGCEAGGTNFNAPLLQANKKYDRIVFLSDMQGWGGHGAPVEAFKEYKAKYKADPFIYSFDLAGYGTGMFAKHKLLCMTGLSDRVFDLMRVLEQDKDALIKTIEQVSFDGTVNRFVDGLLVNRNTKVAETEEDEDD